MTPQRSFGESLFLFWGRFMSCSILYRRSRLWSAYEKISMRGRSKSAYNSLCSPTMAMLVSALWGFSSQSALVCPSLFVLRVASYKCSSG
jgi:hypothetical protein